MVTETLPIESIITSIFGGILLAVLIVGYKKLFLGRFVKRLLKNEANCLREAQSFKDLELKSNFLYRFALRNNSSLRKVVYESDEEKGKYYIPEKYLYRALRVYGGKDVDALMIAFLIIVLLVAFAAASLYVPAVINWAATYFG